MALSTGHWALTFPPHLAPRRGLVLLDAVRPQPVPEDHLLALDPPGLLVRHAVPQERERVHGWLTIEATLVRVWLVAGEYTVWVCALWCMGRRKGVCGDVMGKRG